MQQIKDVSLVVPRLAFIRQVLKGLPLAEATLSLQRFVLEPPFLNELFDRYRGRCYQSLLTFASFVDLLSEALHKHGGHARPALLAAAEEQRLPTTPRAFYGKLSRMPLPVSEALVLESTRRLAEIQLDLVVNALPESLNALQVYMIDGKKLKRVAKRLLATRGHPGRLFGGKMLVAWNPRTGLAFAMTAHADGEKNDSPLVPGLLPQVARVLPGPRLAVADRQFCDLVQIQRLQQNGDHFLLRYHAKLHFHPDVQRPTRTYLDQQGRQVFEEWGYLGSVADQRRVYVRRLTLKRAAAEDVILVTDLLDEALYPAVDLLDVYLQRWGIERVFQQITEVLSLHHLIASTPQGTVFQAAFCLLWYNLVQVVRSYIAAAQPQPLAIEDVSTEMLFRDVRDQLVALSTLVAAEEAQSLLEPSRTSRDMAAHLRRLLRQQWKTSWRKAANQRPRHRTEKAKRSGAHTSVYRLLQKAREHGATDDG